MKKIWGAMFLLVFSAVGLASWHGQKFNAERILTQSKLSGRTFKGEVQVVSALDGAVSAYLMEEHSVPLTAISFGFDKAGRAYEAKEGVAILAESVLLDGAGPYSRQELRELMYEKGIKLAVSAENDRLSFSLTFVKEFEKEALDVLKAVLYAPHLNKTDLDLARQQLSVVKKRQQENPQYQLGQFVKEKFYGNHPYGKDSIPDDDKLQSINEKDIREYLKNFMAKDTLKVGVAGDMDKAETEAFLAQAFAGLVSKSGAKELPELNLSYDEDIETMLVPNSAQSFVMMTTLGVKRLDEDFYPLYVADYILGGSGLSSRLNQGIREKEGLTYGIYSYFSNSDRADLWQIYFSATPENAEKALASAQKLYAEFYENGITFQELEQAKKGLLNSFNLRFSSLMNIAEMLEQMQVQNLGADFLKQRQATVQSITLESVNDAIRRRMPTSLTSKGKTRVFIAQGAK